jgi:hypothetical protein
MAELVWDDEAGEWVYPEDDGSEELEDTPGEARWRQEQQDARERDIRRRNALAGNPDPRYAEEFLDLYPPEDPQTETGTGTPGTPGNQNEPPPMPPPPTPLRRLRRLRRLILTLQTLVTLAMTRAKARSLTANTTRQTNCVRWAYARVEPLVA